jgi:hypothetical protein
MVVQLGVKLIYSSPLIVEEAVCVKLDFGHFARKQIAGKWQADEGCIEAMLEAMEFCDVCVFTRLHLISAQRRPALA